jgi:hypothetical protein
MLFSANPGLLVGPYSVQAGVTLAVFDEFVAALLGAEIEITRENHAGLGRPVFHITNAVLRYYSK